MKTEELRNLEDLVDKELKIADVFRVPISKKDISRIRAYFNQDENLKVIIESCYPTNLENLSRKYTAIFSKKGAYS